MSIIEVEDLSFGYESDRKVLDGISFTIDDPSFVCIVGPNGVGKSTLIRCMNGLIKPTSGSVKVMGRNVEEYDLKELAKIMSYVPVMSKDFNVLTVLDTVLIGRYAHQKWKTTAEDLDIAYKALEAMEIDHLAMRNFNELVLDEPTSNLDVRHQMYVSAFLKILVRKTETTVVMVSHDLNLSAKFADRIVVMEPPGKIYGMGEPKEVVTKEMLRKVYNVESNIIDDNGSPHVVLQSVLF